MAQWLSAATRALCSAGGRASTGLVQIGSALSQVWNLELLPGAAASDTGNAGPAALTAADFKRSLADDFTFEDFGLDLPEQTLKGRLVVFADTDHRSDVIKQKIKRGLALLNLGPGDVLLAEFVDASKYPNLAGKFCHGVPRRLCRFFAEPVDTAEFLRERAALKDALGAEVIWMRQHVPDYFAARPVPDSEAKYVVLVLECYNVLAQRKPYLMQELESRYQRIQAQLDNHRDLTARSNQRREQLYIDQIKDALSEGGTVAVVTGAKHARSVEGELKMREELVKLHALVCTPRMAQRKDEL